MIGSRAWIPISLQISRRSTRLFCTAVFPSSGAIFDLDGIQQRVAELDERMSAPDFWDDQNAARALMAEVNPLKHRMEAFSGLKSRLEDIDATIELAQEADDDDLGREAVEEFAKWQKSLADFELLTLLNGPQDQASCYVTIHAGAGGTEACDWASMLFRMYSKWADKKGFTLEVLDSLDGDEAGIKSITFQVNGENAYGLLKSEKGVHRLVRISPFNAAGKRQTSFVSCDVMPDIEKDLDVEINDEDIRIDTYRSSGAGGQHINKTSSAVRMTHIPTGIVAACQNERSQFQNKEQCLRLLKAKLFELEMQKREQVKKGIEGEQQAIEWGSQIRSYVFQPYTLVKDNRTGIETGNIQSVMDGGLNPFIEGFLKHKKFNNA